MRKSGILLPISSIPSRFGIGGFSKEAYEFVDKLGKSGIAYWQILPLGPTGYGDSPYQSFSTFAGNPYYIDIEPLIYEGLLSEEECAAFDYGGSENYVDYEKIYLTRFNILRLAYNRSSFRDSDEYKEFYAVNADWLDDYALYMAVKNSFGGISWSEWPEDIRIRRPEALDRYRAELASEIDFFRFQQFLFASQWAKLKSYANGKNVKIIGDIPIYVALDGADTWSDPRLFQFDKEIKPIDVAGCPPDAFSATGQLWGNPLYDWDYHASTGYEWWIKRMTHCFKLYDVVRVDHFRGFDEYYAIPAGDKTAEHGEWRKGPGYALFEAVKNKLGDVPIIAEDLGFLTPSVLELVAKTGYPGMKVLQFAFDSREPGNYLPHNYPENCIVYTGTHDNETTRGWYRIIPDCDRRFADEYMNNKNPEPESISWDFIKLALASVAKLAVIPMQDYLNLDCEARTNTPSTLGNNWKWRMGREDFSDELAERIHRLNWMYSRL